MENREILEYAYRYIELFDEHIGVRHELEKRLFEITGENRMSSLFVTTVLEVEPHVVWNNYRRKLRDVTLWIENHNELTFEQFKNL